MGSKLLMVGDFNIHVDVAGNATACKLLSLLESHGLTQNVHSPMHLDGHTLDLVISRPSDNVISNCAVSALIEDHFAVHMLVVHLSLSSGVFPDEMKLAFVTPLLKKPYLCVEERNNYRPVSLLSFLSKLI